MENPLISLHGQEKSSHPKPTTAIFSRKIQHKVFWDVFLLQVNGMLRMAALLVKYSRSMQKRAVVRTEVITKQQQGEKETLLRDRSDYSEEK